MNAAPHAHTSGAVAQNVCDQVVLRPARRCGVSEGDGVVVLLGSLTGQGRAKLRVSAPLVLHAHFPRLLTIGEWIFCKIV
jgi:hypothetical protein